MHFVILLVIHQAYISYVTVLILTVIIKKRNKILFFKLYSFLNSILAINHFIGVFFTCFKLFIGAVFNCECCNAFTVGFNLKCFLVELQSHDLIFKVFTVHFLQANFDFNLF